MAGTTYILKHWQIAEIGEMLVLEGHVYGRSEFPDGIWVQTSELLSWEKKGLDVLFHTLNSSYICSIRDYILNGNTLEFLCDASLEPLMETAAELRREHCRSFLRETGEKNILFLNWEGCDCPYLRWAASVCGDEVEFTEMVSSGSWVTADLSFNSGKQMTVAVPAGMGTHLFLPGPEFEELPIYIENTGERAVTCLINGRMPVRVAPGEYTLAG